MSAQALADRLVEMGSDLTRRSISKIENNERGVSLDEWLQLAHALAVPPPLLFLDLEGGQDVEIAPAVVLHPWLAWEWVIGDGPPVMSDRTVARVEEFGRALTAVRLYRREREAAGPVHAASSNIRAAEFTGDEEQLRAARAAYVEALRGLAAVLDEMIEHDMTPPGKARPWVDTMRELDLLRHPDRVTVYDPGDGDGDAG